MKSYYPLKIQTRQHLTGCERPGLMDHIHAVDLPERLSLMTRFFPCFRLMFRRYLWTAAGTWTSGPAVITCCGEPFTLIGCLIPDAWLNSMRTAVQWVLTEFSRGSITMSSKKSHCSLDIYTEKGCNDILWNIRMHTVNIVQSCLCPPPYLLHTHLSQESSRGLLFWQNPCPWALYSIIFYDLAPQFCFSFT